MHKAYGLMRKLVNDSELTNRPVFKWTLWAVIEKCRGRKCSTCVLKDYCLGIAKSGDGYYKIDDAISQFERTKRLSFIREMLCDEAGKKNQATTQSGSGSINIVDLFFKEVNSI